jgi:hypothetical protein
MGSTPYHSKKRYKQVTKNSNKMIKTQSQRITFEFLEGASGNESDPHKVRVRVVTAAASKSIMNACGFNECLF